MTWEQDLQTVIQSNLSLCREKIVDFPLNHLLWLSRKYSTAMLNLCSLWNVPIVIPINFLGLYYNHKVYKFHYFRNIVILHTTLVPQFALCLTTSTKELLTLSNLSRKGKVSYTRNKMLYCVFIGDSVSSHNLAGYRYLNQKNKAILPMTPATIAQIFMDSNPPTVSKPSRIAIPMNIRAPIRACAKSDIFCSPFFEFYFYPRISSRSIQNQYLQKAEIQDNSENKIVGRESALNEGESAQLSYTYIEFFSFSLMKKHQNESPIHFQCIENVSLVVFSNDDFLLSNNMNSCFINISSKNNYFVTKIIMGDGLFEKKDDFLLLFLGLSPSFLILKQSLLILLMTTYVFLYTLKENYISLNTCFIPSNLGESKRSNIFPQRPLSFSFSIWVCIQDNYFITAAFHLRVLRLMLQTTQYSQSQLITKSLIFISN